MRPRIVEFLNQASGTAMFSWLVPESVFFYGLAMAVCTVVFYRRCAKSGLSRYHALGAAVWVMVGGLVGSRAFYLLQHMDRVAANPSIVLDLGGGAVSWGAYVFGALAFWLYFVFYRQEVSDYADVAGSCLGLAPFIARWACFLNGDDYGTLSNAPWSVVYPKGSYPYLDHLRSGLIGAESLYSMPVHPVQLYISLYGLLLFFVLSWAWKRIRMRKGMLFLLFFALYSFGRFSLEYFRGDVSRGFVGPFSTGQLMSIVILFVVVAALVRFKLVGEKSFA